MFYKLEELKNNSSLISVKTVCGDVVKGVILKLENDYLILACVNDRRKINVFIVLDHIVGWVIWK